MKYCERKRNDGIIKIAKRLQMSNDIVLHKFLQVLPVSITLVLAMQKDLNLARLDELMSLIHC